MSLFRSTLEVSHHENSHPSAIPAEAGVHGSLILFSEAFLDTSSVRDSLPEQYRTQFDELRSDILAFCHDFNIPVETLRSKEAFGLELTSKRIPQERMAEAVSLFEHLEHLVTNKEPLKEKENPIEYTDRLYHLSEQYTSQVSLLERVGILKDGAITGIDGNIYPIPTLEQIAQRLYERQEELETKRDQGFTKLLLVPFGMSLDALCKTLEQFLLAYKKDHSDFDLENDDPIWTLSNYKEADTGESPELVYYPKFFDSKSLHGQTKTEILEEQAISSSSFPGWTVHLLQPSDPSNIHSPGFASIPRLHKGKTYGEKNARPDLEAGRNINRHYFSNLQQEVKDDPTSPYFQEFGLTPEDWIIAFITHLQETDKPLDDYGDGKESVTYLAGVWFSSSSGMPCAYWSHTFLQVRLDKDDPHHQDENIGVRFSVLV